MVRCIAPLALPYSRADANSITRTHRQVGLQPRGTGLDPATDTCHRFPTENVCGSGGRTMTSRRRLFTVTGTVAGGALLVGAAGGAVATAAAQAPPAPVDPWAEVPKILARIKPPTFPKKDFLITDYGAKGDGKFDNTATFAKAIKACNAAGGGRGVVPAGKFLTGAIEMLDNVNLNVGAGATILFSTDPKKYPLVLTRWQGIECYNYSPLIHAEGRTNLAVTGTGTLDGQGAAWKPFGGGGS